MSSLRRSTPRGQTDPAEIDSLANILDDEVAGVAAKSGDIALLPGRTFGHFDVALQRALVGREDLAGLAFFRRRQRRRLQAGTTRMVRAAGLLDELATDTRGSWHLLANIV